MTLAVESVSPPFKTDGVWPRQKDRSMRGEKGGEKCY